YLQKFEYAQAMKLFDEFAAMNDAEVHYKAFGLAGQAVVLNRMRCYSESADKLAQLWPMRDKLDGEMRSWVTNLLRSNRGNVGESQPLRRWSQWFRESSPQGESTKRNEPRPGDTSSR